MKIAIRMVIKTREFRRILDMLVTRARRVSDGIQKMFRGSRSTLEAALTVSIIVSLSDTRL
jgi:hypothetical protein